MNEYGCCLCKHSFDFYFFYINENQMSEFHKKALCILTRKYNESWISFLKQFSDNYTIYIVIDDNEIIYDPLPIHNIHLIQIKDENCKSHNYYGSSIASNLKEIVAWDKALFFFNRINPLKYSYVWFLEDDVFLYDEKLLQNIDNQYPTSDLISSFHEINDYGNIYSGWNHWVNVIHKIGTPWAHSLVCCIRLSDKLLNCVDNYRVDRPLLFIEALFNTLAMHYNLKIENPSELSCINYNNNWNESNIVDSSKIYHPVKNTELHQIYRDILSRQ
jgi:hypothetical protein